MYLHLGGDVLIRKDEVVAIIDLEITNVGQINQMTFSNTKNNSKDICYICESGKEKTLIVTTTNLYFSPISTITLYKRSFAEIGKDY